VVVRETVMPGWAVAVDGTDRPLVTAELGSLGVFVPPGRHTVTFAYRSLASRAVGVSIAGLVAMLAFAAASLVRRRRSG